MSQALTGEAVAQAALALWREGHSYAEMDCQAFVERAVAKAGGRIAFAGSNDMARNACVWLYPLAEAKRRGALERGALLFIHEREGEPSKYRADGLGNFSHVGIFVGENALTDVDRNGKRRACSVVHSSATMGRVAGSTLSNGWTHAGRLLAVTTDASTDESVDASALPSEHASVGGAGNALVGGEASGGASGDHAGDATNADAPIIAYLTADSGRTVNVRAARSLRAVVRARLPIGTCVRVLTEKGEWVNVRADGGAHGWVLRRFLASDRAA